MRRTALLYVALVALYVVAPAHAQQTVGLFLNDEDSFDGYTLLVPMASTDTFLIDNEGRVINSWTSATRARLSGYLRENGNLLRMAEGGGAAGSQIEEFAWDGTRIWEYESTDPLFVPHHDVEPLPNGNVLILVYDYKTSTEAIAAGRDPSFLTDNELKPDHVIEMEPTPPSGGVIVWEWHVWDHLIQDHDPTKANFGVVEDHPELIDINFTALTGGAEGSADWTHANSIDYNPQLDQIVLSIRQFSEIWVIDHSTTTAEAASHLGGNSGKGGDLLYRWGNPAAYRRGDADDRRLWVQHDALWIEPGRPGEGNLLVFNNGAGRPGDAYSQVDEIVPPVDGSGNYLLVPDAAYGPEQPVWSYTAPVPTDFFATNISGSERLPNGNTLICQGNEGWLFEVKLDESMVWEYRNPVDNVGPIVQGDVNPRPSVFKARRYAADYSGLVGKDLTPGDPIEQYTRPIPVADGSGGTDPLTCSKLSESGEQLRVEWDATSCAATDYNLIYGSLAGVSQYLLQGSECGIGIFGSHDWLTAPPGDLFFLVVGVDDTGVYESSWGQDGSGGPRKGTSPSNQCGATTKDVVEICP